MCMKSIGLDVGSTTLKAVMLNACGDPVFHRYLRHNADVSGVVRVVLRDAAEAAQGALPI